ncbi:MAG: 4-hydroxy-3-methylbut-2-enyl diphosphate reductase [Alphaproteobacteria bacterium]
MEIILAAPRGFCAGVTRAIDIVEKALKKYGAPVYVRHEIVHNKYVVDDLKKKGAVFVSEIDEIPEGAVTIFSAHGVSSKVEESAKDRNLPVIDATCPLVTKVHNEAKRNEEQGRQIILIGHAKHPEVEGTAGRVKQEVILVSSIKDVEKIKVTESDKLAYVTQTTLSVDDTRHIINKLKEKFPSISGPDLKDICYATQNRQNAVKELAKTVEVILVIGAVNSSNSNRLKDLGLEMNIASYLINDFKDIDLEWFKDVSRVGITAGASAPEILVTEVIDFLKDKFNANISIMDGIIENVKFKLPKEVN